MTNEVVLNRMSKFDLYYRKLILSQFFTKGWGDFETLNKYYLNKYWDQPS